MNYIYTFEVSKRTNTVDLRYLSVLDLKSNITYFVVFSLPHPFDRGNLIENQITQFILK